MSSFLLFLQLVTFVLREEMQRNLYNNDQDHRSHMLFRENALCAPSVGCCSHFGTWSLVTNVVATNDDHSFIVQPFTRDYHRYVHLLPWLQNSIREQNSRLSPTLFLFDRLCVFEFVAVLGGTSLVYALLRYSLYWISSRSLNIISVILKVWHVLHTVRWMSRQTSIEHAYVHTSFYDNQLSKIDAHLRHLSMKCHASAHKTRHTIP